MLRRGVWEKAPHRYKQTSRNTLNKASLSAYMSFLGKDKKIITTRINKMNLTYKLHFQIIPSAFPKLYLFWLIFCLLQPWTIVIPDSNNAYT
jgi:uncharacterized protein VirK/YbjX